MYADDTTIYFNLKDIDRTCVEAEITKKLEEVNF